MISFILTLVLPLISDSKQTTEGAPALLDQLGMLPEAGPLKASWPLAIRGPVVPDAGPTAGLWQVRITAHLHHHNGIERVLDKPGTRRQRCRSASSLTVQTRSFVIISYTHST